MRRRRLGVGAELAPLVLILACLAGSFGLIVAAYRRVNSPRATPTRPPVLALAPAISPPPVLVAAAPPVLKPAPVAALPPPADPTPQVLAELTAAEAEQLLEASKANRKAQALDEARQNAVSDSERWRRRQSLIHSQVNTLESKVRKVEVDLDALALERDALETELDAKKAAVARAKSRPSQAILPHKGPNGTWRRPIVVECRNGAAIVQPQGIEFGLLDLESGFGAINPFVATVAREAMRVQHQASPDGAQVVPYIFFLVRPDGIRSYYEARGRLEPLGITFGYELADAEWEIEFPDLNDLTTWDGSASGVRSSPGLAATAPRAGLPAPAEDSDLPSWPNPRGTGNGGGGSGSDPSSPFTFGGRATGGGNSPPSAIMGRGLAGSGLAGRPGSGSGSGEGTGSDSMGGFGGGEPGSAGAPPAGFPASFLAGAEGTAPLGATSQPGAGTKLASGGNGPAGPPRVSASGRIAPAGRRGGMPGSAGTNGSMARGGPGPFGVPGAGAGAPAGNVPGGKPGGSAAEAPPIELALDGSTADAPGGISAPDRDQPAGRGGAPAALPPMSPADSVAPSDLALNGPTPDPAGDQPPLAEGQPDAADPASTFVWPGGPNGDGKKTPKGPAPSDPTLAFPSTNADRAPQVAEGADPTLPANGGRASGNPPGGPGQARPGGSPGGSGGTQAARRMLGQVSSSGASSSPTNGPPPISPPMGLGLNAPPLPSSVPNMTPPPGMPPLAMNLPIPNSLPTPTEAAAAVQRQMNAPPNLADWTPPGSIVDKTFEVVVVCGPGGVILQPGNYRVTADALQDREGLFKKQLVALVKNRRAADPTTQVEPRIRFLVQPRGFDSYRAARTQFYLSGLSWPTSTQVSDPDPLVIRSRGVW